MIMKIRKFNENLDQANVRELSEKKWKTIKGESISIKDMSDDHIINTIKMILDNRTRLKISDRKEWILTFTEELYSR